MKNMQKDAKKKKKNLMGMLETYNKEKSMMHQEGKSVSCQ